MKDKIIFSYWVCVVGLLRRWRLDKAGGTEPQKPAIVRRCVRRGVPPEQQGSLRAV